MNCGHKKAVSLAQNLTFESGVQSSVKLASYSFLVCVFIFLKLLRAAKQTFHLMASSLISLVFINGSGLAGCLAWLCAGGLEGRHKPPAAPGVQPALWGSFEAAVLRVLPPRPSDSACFSAMQSAFCGSQKNLVWKNHLEVSGPKLG